MDGFDLTLVRTGSGCLSQIAPPAVRATVDRHRRAVTAPDAGHDRLAGGGPPIALGTRRWRNRLAAVAACLDLRIDDPLLAELAERFGQARL